MDIEELDKVLDYPGLTVRKAACGKEMFERLRSFEINGQYYSIEWWANAMYLHVGLMSELVVSFSHVAQSNTWPHRSKMNFQFYNNGEICAVLKIE